MQVLADESIVKLAVAEKTEPSAFKISRMACDPKTRWVDGTPEYSFYVNPLRKLFPGARFIHVVRDVRSVVRSMINFQRTGGPARHSTCERATRRACPQSTRRA